MACKSVLIGMPPLTTEQCVVCYSTRSVHRLLCLDRPYFLGLILLRSQQTLTKATSQYRADMVSCFHWRRFGLLFFGLLPLLALASVRFCFRFFRWPRLVVQISKVRQHPTCSGTGDSNCLLLAASLFRCAFLRLVDMSKSLKDDASLERACPLVGNGGAQQPAAKAGGWCGKAGGRGHKCPSPRSGAYASGAGATKHLRTHIFPRPAPGTACENHPAS